MLSSAAKAAKERGDAYVGLDLLLVAVVSARGGGVLPLLPQYRQHRGASGAYE